MYFFSLSWIKCQILALLDCFQPWHFQGNSTSMLHPKMETSEFLWVWQIICLSRRNSELNTLLCTLCTLNYTSTLATSWVVLNIDEQHLGEKKNIKQTNKQKTTNNKTRNKTKNKQTPPIENTFIMLDRGTYFEENQLKMIDTLYENFQFFYLIDGTWCN